MVIGLQIGKLHGGGGIRLPPALSDSDKPGLFRVNDSVSNIGSVGSCLAKTRAFQSPIRLATRVLVVAPMTFMMTQQRTSTICNPKLITILARLENIERANQIARMRNSIIS